YLAICRPFQYHSVMSKHRVIKLVCLFWLTPCCIITVNTLLIARLNLCSSYINRLLCVNWSIVALACYPNETFINGIFSNFILTIYVIHGAFIFWSYIYIVKNCANSIENRAKFMQTSVPHLVSLFTFIITSLIDVVFIRFVSENIPKALKNFISIELFVIPLIMNPLIYGFKLTKVQNRFIRLVAFKNNKH
ncbi:olfactory receptor 52J3-like, partial [Austrofundulus limnaeus]|uniref:Olfactory receptor 52J3-like n=1 Tax=Austrofundulus limnaeus TaxID=52670 RepID=A0A2I4CJY4_AUSLI